MALAVSLVEIVVVVMVTVVIVSLEVDGTLKPMTSEHFGPPGRL